MGPGELAFTQRNTLLVNPEFAKSERLPLLKSIDGRGELERHNLLFDERTQPKQVHIERIQR